MLSSEFQIIENPLKEEESEENETTIPEIENVTGVYLLNQHLIVHGAGTWVLFNMRAERLETGKSPMNKQEWPILCKQSVLPLKF